MLPMNYMNQLGETMSKYITAEFYEISLKTRNRRQIEGSDLPPIDHVSVFSAFRLLESHTNLIGQRFPYNNGDSITTLEHIDVQTDRIDLVFGYYDKTAIHRTLKDTNTGTENVQKRATHEAIKHFCHCVIKPTGNPLISEIGIERLKGCPVSRVQKTLKQVFDSLQALSPNAEGIFQVTNPHGAANHDGTDNIVEFLLNPAIHPLCDDEMRAAIESGRFNKIRLRGKKFTLDDPHNKLDHLQAELNFKVQPLGVDETPETFLQSIISAATRNNLALSNIKTFAIIENEDTGNEQSIELATGDELNSAFVLRKRFDATLGRNTYPDNTQVNSIFLAEIWGLFI